MNAAAPRRHADQRPARSRPVRSGRRLGLRPRQHALPAPRQPLRAGRPAHPRLCRAAAQARPDEAQRLQKDYYRRYGTTLRGLMVEHGITPDDFLEYVHDIDHSPVEADPRAGRGHRDACRDASSSSPTARGRTPRRSPSGSASPAISRTSSTSSARSCCRSPTARPMTGFIAATGVEPKQCGDVRGSGAQPRSAASARHDDGAGRADRRRARSSPRTGSWKGRDAPHVDYVTDDLPAFLEDVIVSIGKR